MISEQDLQERQAAGERLRRMRRSRQLKLQDMGEILGVSAGTVSRYEKGILEPSIVVLKIYCDYFHTDMNELTGCRSSVTLPYDAFELSCEEQQMIEGYRRRNETVQKVIRTLCFDGDSYRSEVQERNERIKAAKELLKEK